MERTPHPGEAIDAFWRWWADHRELLQREVASAGTEASFVEPLSDRVAAISPELDWEFGKGLQAEHMFVVSAKGDPRLRVLAERWRAAGPGNDDLFEFHCARQRGPGDPEDQVLRFDQHDFDFASLRFDLEVDNTRQRFGVVAHHPVFAEAEENLSANLVFIGLDHVLGEDAVETWLTVHPPSTEPAGDDTIGVLTLRKLVEEALERWPERSWSIFRGENPEHPGLPLVLAACAGHKYLLDPLFDVLCLVRIPYEPEAHGMPDADTREELDRLDQNATAELGDGIRVLARQTGDGVRTIWIYLRAENGPERAELEKLVEGYEGASLQTYWDPGWRQLPV